ncbi:MAG: cytochrome c3 family protein [Verrucomicrobiae bacterium]|nr:cytochrome c3 family protein [Verrucomicrobiae bacterium]|tara:strand:- start:3818 stop:5170 length:1353 start_codon:yes stop_codon:yes gene_type:complete
MHLLSSYFSSIFLGTVMLVGVTGGLLFLGKNQELLTPGPMTHGHHQIELRCDACHGDSENSMQQACLDCHENELKRVDDSHPIVKFLDPRNANRLKKIDARKCVSCHREHQPEQTNDMGVTLPNDYCAFCHQEIAEERETHVGLGHETCATAGCHNYHDNSSLYESFIGSHLDEPDLKTNGRVPSRGAAKDKKSSISQQLEQVEANMPANLPVTRELLNEWQTSLHSKNLINCRQCHSPAQNEVSLTHWDNDVTIEQCKQCHEYEAKGFLEGKHGMRLALGLPHMKPSMARLPMKTESLHQELNCTSCHSSHRFDTKKAAVQACLKCHDDEHSKSYLNSPHYLTWLNESRGVEPSGTGVSCATCHMPRIQVTQYGETSIKVDHNQNNSLRPNEKMIRSVCLNCHGLQFSINSLADESLINLNFRGKSTIHVTSLEMVAQELLKSQESPDK